MLTPLFSTATPLPPARSRSLAAAETSATTAGIEAAQEALAPWFLPVLLSGALVFTIGVELCAGASSSPLGDRVITRVVVVALIVFALSRFVPLAALQLYVRALRRSWPCGRSPTRCGRSPRPNAAGASRLVRAG
jgi:hypothetical protein